MSNCDDESIHSVTTRAFYEIIDRIDRQTKAGAERIVDCRSALERLDNDVDLFQDLLTFFFADSAALMEKIRASIASGDADGLHRAAHRLKGLLSNFDARPALAALTALETMGRQNELAGAKQAGERLDREIERLTELLREFCPEAE